MIGQWPDVLMLFANQPYTSLHLTTSYKNRFAKCCINSAICDVSIACLRA